MGVEAVVVALGNPGTRYLKTRHNAGFMLADLLVQSAGASFKNKPSFEADYAEFLYAGKTLGVLKPQTFMNLSGKSIAAFYNKNKDLKAMPLIVLHDEVDLPLGRVRIKNGGSDAGHNGLRSLREHLGTGDSIRIRLGVGRLQVSDISVADYVLCPFEKSEETQLISMLQGAQQVLEAYLNEGLAKAQNVAGEVSHEC